MITRCNYSPTYCDPRWYQQCYGPNGYPAPDQIRQTYFWNNTWNGGPAIPTVDPTDYVQNYIKEGRDYFLEEQLDGYTPYIYPHPLTRLSLVGDVNRDKKININDVQACVNHILGIQYWDVDADVNEDGNADVKDVQKIINLILGK